MVAYKTERNGGSKRYQTRYIQHSDHANMGSLGDTSVRIWSYNESLGNIGILNFSVRRKINLSTFPRTAKLTPIRSPISASARHMWSYENHWPPASTMIHPPACWHGFFVSMCSFPHFVVLTVLLLFFVLGVFAFQRITIRFLFAEQGLSIYCSSHSVCTLRIMSYSVLENWTRFGQTPGKP